MSSTYPSFTTDSSMPEYDAEAAGGSTTTQGPPGPPGVTLLPIPSTADLNDITTPGVYSLVDPSTTGDVAHDATITDPLWTGTFFGRWATLTVAIGDPNLYGSLFQTIAFHGDGENGIEYIQRNTYDTLAGNTFYKLTPFTAAPRQIVSIFSQQVVPANSNPGDVWFARNTAQTLTFQKFPTFGNPDVLDLTFVTDVRKITFAAVAGITIVVPLGKVATLTRGAVRATGIATVNAGGNGTVFLSGDLDSSGGA
jgi:hypothetical protein